MPYTVPSASDFKTRYAPAFDSVSDTKVDAVLAEAAGAVDTDWIESDYQPALMAYAAHLLTLDGAGSSTEAQLKGFKSLKVGSLALEMNPNSASAGTIGSTSYGLRYLELAQKNKGGPRFAPAVLFG